MRPYISRVIVVEGKYDKIKLDSLIDAIIIPTDGFGIFKNKAQKQTLKQLARQHGAVILTDSDRAGFKIRKYLHDILTDCEISDIYIPDIYGKEARKDSVSAEGKLGVEGMPAAILKNLLDKLEQPPRHNADPISEVDLYNAGLFGGQNSAARRRAFQSYLGLPGRMNKTMLLKTLNAQFDKRQFFDFLHAFQQDEI